MNIVRTAVEVLNKFNLVQMSNVCSFGKRKRNAGHDKERKKKWRQLLRTKKDDAFKLQPELLAKISTLEQHNLQAAAEIDSLKEVNLSLSFLSVVLILFDVQEVQKPVSTVVTALLDKNAKLEQQARKDQILAFFLSKMQFFASSGLHYTNWLSCRCPTWRFI